MHHFLAGIAHNHSGKLERLNFEMHPPISQRCSRETQRLKKGFAPLGLVKL